MKLKISIHGTEAFPIYFVYDAEYDWHGQLEIDHKTYKRWKKVFREFENVQEEICKAMKASGHDCWSNSIPELWND